MERIESLEDPRIGAYRALRDRDVARREGLFIAEGRYVVGILLGERSVYEAESVLVTPTALDAIRGVLGSRAGDRVPVYVAEQRLMNGIVGFDIHRGCLAAGRRGAPGPAEDLAARLGDASGRSIVVVLEGLNNHDNIGGIFRNAAAFGADAVLLDPACADPLYRKSIRVSMGGALVVAHARFASWPGGLETLRWRGYATVGLTPRWGAPEIEAIGDTLRAHRRVALVLGAEGPGLTEGAMERLDLRVRVAMRTDLVDSLNVASTSAIALHELSRGGVR